MTSRLKRLSRIAVCGATVLSVGAVALASGAPSRQALLSQLERPAIAARATRLTSHRLGYTLTLMMTPDRASAPNELSLAVARAGTPLTRARLAVAFSMPAMDMWRALTLAPRATTRGSYTATVPVLGMAGDWQLAVRVTRAGAGPLRFTVDLGLPQ